MIICCNCLWNWSGICVSHEIMIDGSDSFCVSVSALEDEILGVGCSSFDSLLDFLE